MNRIKKRALTALIGVAVISLVITNVAASPKISGNTPLYAFRMEQASSEMSFLPKEKTNFTYTTERGCTLNYDTAEACNVEGSKLVHIGPYTACIFLTCYETCVQYTCWGTCDFTCWGTCDFTCWGTCRTCWDTCQFTCLGTCEFTCWGTCFYPTCFETCVQRTCRNTCDFTCWGTCDFTCAVTCYLQC